ncbi:TetR/AcrR family transcriptional regulator [Bradyrhizobium sp.]|uniref:TetR/AcrR family transcriptional regulator n=1 Tax=Bradyrhizobium sp. TaxID=376 RepID=UPI003C5BD164
MAVIVEAAARILEAHGHEGFSTNAVAERAGVSVGSLYQYFPEKDALIGALIVRETSRLIDDAEAAQAQATGRAALSALIIAAVGHQLRRPELARLLDFEEARLPFDAETQRVGDGFRAIAMAILARSDLPRQPDREIAAQDVMAIIRGIIDAAGVHGETDQRKLASRVQRAVFGYLNTKA